MARNGRKEETVTVRILEWNEMKGRNDVKHPRWFRCENRMLEHDDIFKLSHSEIIAWIYMLCLASQNDSDTVTINFEKADRFAKVGRAEILSAIEKLVPNQLALVNVTKASRRRNAPVTDSSATGQDKTEQNNTEQDITTQGSSEAAFGPDQLLALWNDKCGSLSKARELNDDRKKKARSRLAEKPDPVYWASVIDDIRESDFCNGRTQNSDWEATFDWLLQPDVHLKVLEGKYRNRAGKGLRPTKTQTTIDNLAKQHEMIIKGEI